MKAKELKQLIELLYEKGFSEFEIERKGFRMRLSRFADVSSSAKAANQPVIVASPIPVPVALPAAPPPRDVVSSPPSAEHALEHEGQGGAIQAPKEEDLHIIKAPIVGTFYRAASPQSEPFVRIGDHVDQDTVVCIIEAMKLMNEIQAEAPGEVVRCFVENGQPVEYGQKLFGIRA